MRLIDELKEAFGASIARKEWIEEEMTVRLLEKVTIFFSFSPIFS